MSRHLSPFPVGIFAGRVRGAGVLSRTRGKRQETAMDVMWIATDPGSRRLSTERRTSAAGYIPAPPPSSSRAPDPCEWTLSC